MAKMGKSHFMANIPTRMRERLGKQERYKCSLFRTKSYVNTSLKRYDGSPNVSEPPPTVKKQPTAQRHAPVKLKSILKVTAAPPARKQLILKLKMPLLYWQQMRKMESREMVKLLKAERRKMRKTRKVHSMPRICEVAEIEMENRSRYKAVVMVALREHWKERKKMLTRVKHKRKEAASAAPTLSESTLVGSGEEAGQ